jgi:hypothetical protein
MKQLEAGAMPRSAAGVSTAEPDGPLAPTECSIVDATVSAIIAELRDNGQLNDTPGGAQNACRAEATEMPLHARRPYPNRNPT